MKSLTRVLHVFLQYVCVFDILMRLQNVCLYLHNTGMIESISFTSCIQFKIYCNLDKKLVRIFINLERTLKLMCMWTCKRNEKKIISNFQIIICCYIYHAHIVLLKPLKLITIHYKFKPIKLRNIVRTNCKNDT